MVVLSIATILLACGCVQKGVDETKTNVTQTPATQNTSVVEPKTTEKWVQVNLLDGTSVVGKYVSDTAAYTTIVAMYTIDTNAQRTDKTGQTVKDWNKYMAKANGDTIAIKNALINSMVIIDNPTSFIATRLQAQSEGAVTQKACLDQHKLCD